MSRYSKPNILLLISAFVGTFAGSLFWTGFPVAFAAIENSPLSSIYALSIFGSVVFDLVGGMISTSKNAKTVSACSLFCSALILALLSIALKLKIHGLVLLLLPPLYFNFSLGSIAENVWLLSLSQKTSVRDSFLNRTTAIIGAKLIGFSLGPIVFMGLGTAATLIVLVLFLIVAVTQLFIQSPNQKQTPELSRTESPSFFLLGMLRKPLLLSALVLTGVMSVPMNLLFVQRLLAANQIHYVSFFWLLAGISSLSAICLLKGSKLRSIWWTLPIVVISCLALYSDPSAIVVVIAGAMYVFSSVYSSAKLQADGMQLLSESHIGMTVGLFNFLIDAGVLVGLAASNSFATEISCRYCSLTLVAILVILSSLRFATHHFAANQT